MDYYKNTKEWRMKYESDIAKYIETEMKQTRKEYIEILLRNKLLAPFQISEIFDLPLHDVEKIAQSL